MLAHLAQKLMRNRANVAANHQNILPLISS
jgi:hypothetical protein